MWRELVERLTEKREFKSPASVLWIEEAEEQLGLALPDELRALLRESNGILGEYGLGLVWPLERIRDDNILFRSKESFRQLYMPFDHLLFFADAGTGDQFAYAIQAGCIRRPDIFWWDHEDDSRTWAAPSLEKYLEWWLTGQMKLQ